MPKNADISTLETYSYSDIITFTCKHNVERAFTRRGYAKQCSPK